MAIHRTAKVTARAIQLAIRNGSFKAPEVTDMMADPPSRPTVTRVLRQLEADGWLERTEPNSSIWRAGELARRHGKMDDYAMDMAEREAVGPD